MKNKILFSIITLFLFLFTPCIVHAGSVNISFGGTNTYSNNKEISIPINATNITGSNLMSVGGKITSSDTSCVSLVSLNATIGTANGNTLAYSNMAGESKNTKIGTAKFKTANKTCSAIITFSNIKVSFTDSSKITPSNISKTIYVKKLNTDNTLKSLTISVGSLSPSFNTNETSYNVNVDSNVSSIKVNGLANDSKATVSGNGTRNLSYGSNKIDIKVKAENGSIKTYTINVNRKDNRSKNSLLKSLVVNNGSLSPKFQSNVLKYSLSVDYSVSKLDIKAIAEDSKSKISIVNPNLVAEEITNVIINVTAENGSKKQYVIAVKRGKDPNKKLSTDNTLKTLKPNVGILSPKFDPNKTFYYLYLPYEIDKINLDYEVSDKKYATVKKEGSDILKPDTENKISLIVTAEDGSKKEYTFIVYRGKNPEIDPKTDGESTKIKSLKLKNGKLVKKFDSNVHTYEIEKNIGFSYEYELESKKAYSSVYETKDAIYIVVENDNGDIEVYSMHVKEKDNNIIYIIIIGILSIVSGYLLFDKLKKH